MSNTPTKTPPTGHPASCPNHPQAQSSAVSYPPPRWVPWKCIAAMMCEDKSYLGCHYNNPKDSPRFKFHKDVGCLALAKHGYLFWKYVTASENFFELFNTKFSKIPDQSRTSKPVADRVSYDKASDHVSTRQVHYPLILSPPLDYSVPPAPIENTLLLLPNEAALMPTSNEYADIYSYYSEDEPVFEEMVIGKKIKPINTYSVVPLSKTLVSTPHKVLNKQRKTCRQTHIATINQAQFDITASAIFLLTALHSVSQAIICAHTEKIPSIITLI